MLIYAVALLAIVANFPFIRAQEVEDRGRNSVWELETAGPGIEPLLFKLRSKVIRIAVAKSPSHHEKLMALL
jgi:hypothetical protein